MPPSLAVLPFTDVSDTPPYVRVGLAEELLNLLARAPNLRVISANRTLQLDPAAGDAEAFKARSLDNAANRCLHHHVFDTDLAVRLGEYPDELAAIASYWFGVMRDCGDDVRELVHDGYPTACVADAAFAYVGAFTRHVNVGFFRGADLADPDGLLQGSGKSMRHVKLGPGREVDAAALSSLIRSAYADMQARLQGD